MNRITAHVVYPKIAKPEPAPKKSRNPPRFGKYVPVKDSKYRPWLPTDLAILKAMDLQTPRPHNRDIAGVLGRSEAAVSSKLDAIKVTA